MNQIEKIEKMIKENDKQWTKKAKYEIVVMLFFLAGLPFVMVITVIYYGVLAPIVVIPIYIAAGLGLFALLAIKSEGFRERDEYIKDALWIYKNWVHNNKLDDDFYRYVHPKNYDKKALKFLALEMGVILIIPFEAKK